MQVASLLNTGYLVVPDFLGPREIKELTEDFDQIYSEQRFRLAGIGKHTVDIQVRRDEIFWWKENPETPAQQHLMGRLEDLKVSCNREFYLGLLEFEGHYAQYSAGGFYQKHLDAFRDDDSRVLSIVLYLNENWAVNQGGEILLHLNPPVRVEPRAGCLVAFLSREVPHEVLPAHQRRRSFAGWFKTSNSSRS